MSPFDGRRPNNYRQIQATLTEERGGRFTLRVMVKPVGAQWNRRHVVSHQHFRMSDPPDSLHGALEVLGRALLGGGRTGADD